MKKITVFLSMLLVATTCAFAQTKTIHVTPDKAKIYVDGSEVGNGSYTLKFNRKTDFYVLKFEAPGYITKQVKLFKNNPNKTIAYKMAKDEFYFNSVGPSGNSGGEEAIDLANKWFDVTAKKGMTEDKIWKRLMSIANKNFENVEIRDKSAGWIRTAWAKTTFETPEGIQVARTRLEIKINTDEDEEITYKVKIYSEVNNDAEECTGEDCFEKSDRVLKKYVDVINELQNKLN